MQAGVINHHSSHDSALVSAGRVAMDGVTTDGVVKRQAPGPREVHCSSCCALQGVDAGGGAIDFMGNVAMHVDSSWLSCLAACTSISGLHDRT